LVVRPLIGQSSLAQRAIQHHGWSGTQLLVIAGHRHQRAQRTHGDGEAEVTAIVIRHRHHVVTRGEAGDILRIRGESTGTHPIQRQWRSSTGGRDGDGSIERVGTTGLHDLVHDQRQCRWTSDGEGERGVTTHLIGDRHGEFTRTQPGGLCIALPVGRLRRPDIGEDAHPSGCGQHHASIT